MEKIMRHKQWESLILHAMISAELGILINLKT